MTVCGLLLAYIYIVFTILSVVEEEPVMISEIQTVCITLTIENYDERYLQDINVILEPVYLS